MAAMADTSGTTGTDREELLGVQEIILDDPVALEKWPQIIVRIIKTAVDVKMLKGFIIIGDYAEAVLKTLELWFSYGENVVTLVFFLRRLKLNALADKLMQRPENRPRKVRSTWFEVGQVDINFAGRTSKLKVLHEKLISCHSQEYCVPVLVAGLGGIGKSTLVRKYAHQQNSFYDGNVILINAGSLDAMRSSFRRLAGKVGILVRDNSPDMDIALEVYKIFRQRKSLFIFDNVEDVEHFNLFKPEIVNPKWCTPYVLITSRRSDLVRLPKQLLILDVLKIRQAVNLILDQVTTSRVCDARTLAVKLHCLPLALNQALAYIHDKYGNRMDSISKYLEQFNTFGIELLDVHQADDDHSISVLTTWNITLERIKESTTTAMQIMNVLAYLDPINVTANFINVVLSKEDNNVEASLRTLEKFSMINISERNVNVHPLVQHVVRTRLSDGEAIATLRLIVTALQKSQNLINTNNFGQGWNTEPITTSHVLYLLQFVLKHPRFLLEESVNLAEIIRYSDYGGRNLGAYVADFRNVLQVLESELSPDHCSVNNIKWMLAKAYYSNGDHSASLELQRSILTFLREDDALKLQIAQLMEVIYKNRGNYDAVVETYDLIISQYEESQNVPDDGISYELVKALEFKANALMSLGKVPEAKCLYQRAYEESTRVLDSLYESAQSATKLQELTLQEPSRRLP